MSRKIEKKAKNRDNSEIERTKRKVENKMREKRIKSERKMVSVNRTKIETQQR